MRDDYLKINYFGKRNKRINALIHEHLNSPVEERRRICLEKLVAIADDAVDAEEFTDYKKTLEKNCAGVVDISDDEYPDRLRKIYDPPLVLFYKGDIAVLNESPCVAIVGSRKCSNYGRQIAHDFAKRLSEAGIVVVSGMAYGIDTNAHIGALNGKGATVAVTGTGIDQCYPPGNRTLHSEINRNGLLLTEFKAGTKPMPYNFPRRNRIISGLSEAIIVIEAGLGSGALITADFALDQGKEVYAVPSGILGHYGKGSNMLIRQGATCLTDIEEIVDLFTKDDDLTPLEKLAEAGMSEAEIGLLEIIRNNDSMDLERLILESGLSINETKSTLMLLTIKDKVYIEPGNKYCAKA